jgi:hypothetical protein
MLVEIIETAKRLLHYIMLIGIPQSANAYLVRSRTISVTVVVSLHFKNTFHKRLTFLKACGRWKCNCDQIPDIVTNQSVGG